MAVNTPIQRAPRDHRLYIWFAIAMPLIVLLGFARSYYLKGVFNGPTLPSLLVHVHGVVMTSWVVLFIVQVWLVSSRRTKVHQRLGLIGSVLALLVAVIGTTTALVAGARDSRQRPAALQFLVIPLGDMLLFAIFVGAALYFRRRLDIHKRLMLLAAVVLLPAAVSRIPLNFIATGGPLVFFGLTDLFLFAFILFDTIKHRKLHPVFLWGALAFIVLQPLRILLAGTNVWIHFAAWLVGFVN
jgi:hypothetical protein